jgi:hypothetical protein
MRIDEPFIAIGNSQAPPYSILRMGLVHFPGTEIVIVWIPLILWLANWPLACTVSFVNS